MNTATNALTAARQRLAAITERRLTAERQLGTIRDVYLRHSLSAAPDDPNSAQRLTLTEQQRLATLERALFTLEASSAIDRVGSLEGRLTALRERIDAESNKLAEADRY